MSHRKEQFVAYYQQLPSFAYQNQLFSLSSWEPVPSLGSTTAIPCKSRDIKLLATWNDVPRASYHDNENSFMLAYIENEKAKCKQKEDPIKPCKPAKRRANVEGIIKVPRGVVRIEQIIEQWEVGSKDCPALKTWSLEMRRQERSIYSQRKVLYDEYRRLGSVARFHEMYPNMAIGRIYALVSAENRARRYDSSAKYQCCIGLIKVGTVQDTRPLRDD